jgi:hypothetical protein
MDFAQLLILQFIAHLLSDFTFQSDIKAKEKSVSGFRSEFLKWHILIVFGLSWLFSFQLDFIYGAFAIALTHWLVDGAKKYIEGSGLRNYAFFIDQIIHLAFIVIIVNVFDNYLPIEPLFVFPISAKYLLIIIGFLICTKPANILIKETFKAFEISISENNDLPNAGKLIGIIERFLVLTFILLNQFEAVGFLIAAKSILRYRNNDTLKTEYVLIGTMLSFGIAIGLGIIIKFIKI